MIKYMDFDTGEYYTLPELEKAYNDFIASEPDEEYESFQDFLDEMISLGRQRIGGIIEIEEVEL